MGDGNISGPTTAAELPWSHDVQDDHALTMVSLSRHKILDMEKSVTQLVDLTKSMKEGHRQDKLEEMEKSLTQLVEDLRLLLASTANPSKPKTTTIPNSTVHEAVNPYPRSAHAWLSGYHLLKIFFFSVNIDVLDSHCCFFSFFLLKFSINFLFV